MGFYPTYLIEVKGLSPTLATALFGFAIVVQPLAGDLQDRIRAKPTLLMLVSAFFVTLLGLWFANGLLSLVVLTLLASSRTSTSEITTPSSRVTARGHQSTGLGFLRTGWLAIGDQGALKEGFLLLAITARIGLLFVLLIPKAK